MKLRYVGQSEVYEIEIPDGSYLLREDASSRRSSRRQVRVIIPWRGGEVALAGSLVPLLATVGAYGLRISSIGKPFVRSQVLDH
jgi:hypothetical protein